MIKKTLLVCLAFLGYNSLVIGQSLTDSLRNQTDVYYMKNSGKVIYDRDSADYVRVIIPPDITDLTLFVVKEYYLNGQLKLVGKSTTGHAQYTGQGTFTEFFPSGMRKRTYTYEKGKQTGDLVWYYPNGKLYYSADYDQDKKQLIIHECMDSTGAILAEKGNGIWVEYDTGFKLVEGKGSIVGGLKDGEWHGNLNDTIRYVCIYNKGVSISGTSYEKSGMEHHFTKDRVEPEYKAGMESFYSFISRKIRYPKLAKENNIQGKVYVAFVVEKNGKLTSIDIVKGLAPVCDAEVLRVMKLCPAWLPGYMYGIPVRVQYSMPVSFTLQGY